jgi:hypothetical protein
MHSHSIVVAVQQKMLLVWSARLLILLKHSQQVSAREA